MSKGIISSSVLASLSATLGLLLLILPHLQVKETSTSLGSVQVGSEYTYSQLSTDNATGTALVLGRTGNSTLGSIVITEPATAGYLNVFNATSTTHSTSTAELIAEFDSSNDVVGTYTFDVAVPSGIFFEVSDAFNGEYTATFR